MIVAECHESARIDRQLVGRCARQGDPGSAQAYVSADDSLLVRYGAWLQRPLRRWANDQGEIEQDLSGSLDRMQRLADRQAAAKRAAIFRRERETSERDERAAR